MLRARDVDDFHMWHNGPELTYVLIRMVRRTSNGERRHPIGANLRLGDRPGLPVPRDLRQRLQVFPREEQPVAQGDQRVVCMRTAMQDEGPESVPVLQRLRHGLAMPGDILRRLRIPGSFPYA